MPLRLEQLLHIASTQIKSYMGAALPKLNDEVPGSFIQCAYLALSVNSFIVEVFELAVLLHDC